VTYDRARISPAPDDLAADVRTAADAIAARVGGGAPPGRG